MGNFVFERFYERFVEEKAMMGAMIFDWKSRLARDELK